MIQKDQLREAMAQYHDSSNTRASLTGLLDVAGFLLCFYLLATCASWAIGIPLAFVQTVFVGRLFILGHDACHGALFRPRVWNRILGRLFFLPTLTPYSLWELGHNSVHHGYSNLKGRDYVWTPFSPEEWRLLSRRRKALERLYRSPWGLGAYYLIEIWWKKLFFPSLGSMTSFRWSYVWDILLNTAFLGIEAAVVCLIAPPLTSRLAAIGFTVVLPFILWGYLMAFAIYCHHTHPSVKWFDNRAEWSFYEAQVCSTTHTTFPAGIGWLLHNIFEHTAHHVDTGIPFFRLRAAQRKLEDLCGPDVIRIEMFSPRLFLAQMRACKLYDYRRRCWTGFDSGAEPSLPIARSSTMSAGAGS